jgi:hypothetical protein
VVRATSAAMNLQELLYVAPPRKKLRFNPQTKREFDVASAAAARLGRVLLKSLQGVNHLTITRKLLEYIWNLWGAIFKLFADIAEWSLKHPRIGAVGFAICVFEYCTGLVSVLLGNLYKYRNNLLWGIGIETPYAGVKYILHTILVFLNETTKPLQDFLNDRVFNEENEKTAQDLAELITKALELVRDGYAEDANLKKITEDTNLKVEAEVQKARDDPGLNDQVNFKFPLALDGAGDAMRVARLAYNAETKFCEAWQASRVLSQPCLPQTSRTQELPDSAYEFNGNAIALNPQGFCALNNNLGENKLRLIRHCESSLQRYSLAVAAAVQKITVLDSDRIYFESSMKPLDLAMRPFLPSQKTWVYGAHIIFLRMVARLKRSMFREHVEWMSKYIWSEQKAIQPYPPELCGTLEAGEVTNEARCLLELKNKVRWDWAEEASLEFRNGIAERIAEGQGDSLIARLSRWSNEDNLQPIKDMHGRQLNALGKIEDMNSATFSQDPHDYYQEVPLVPPPEPGVFYNLMLFLNMVIGGAVDDADTLGIANHQFEELEEDPQEVQNFMKQFN